MWTYKCAIGMEGNADRVLEGGILHWCSLVPSLDVGLRISMFTESRAQCIALWMTRISWQKAPSRQLPGGAETALYRCPAAHTKRDDSEVLYRLAPCIPFIGTIYDMDVVCMSICMSCASTCNASAFGLFNAPSEISGIVHRIPRHDGLNYCLTC